jgi:hypothetical protein
VINVNRPNDKEIRPVGRPYLYIVLGSSPRVSVAASHSLLREGGVDPDLLVKYLFFDYQVGLDPNLDAVLSMPTADFFSPESFVPAALPADKEALEVAENRGLLWPVHNGWYKNPGASAENTGGIAIPAIGDVLALLNRRVLSARLLRMFQQTASHASRDQRVLEGMEEDSVPGRVDVHMLISPHGGTASGAVHEFLGPGGIRACAKQAGVTPNITLSVICRGNLETHDTDRADLNQFTTLQYLRAAGSEAYVSPLTGQIATPCDRLFLFSNQNTHGDLLNHEQLLLEHGNSHHFLAHTPAGAKVRQRLVDLPPVEFDEEGDPKIAHTMAQACIGWDNKRVVGYNSQRASSLFYRALLAEGEPARIWEQAAAMARQNGIVESDRENQITTALMNPRELGENVSARARASLIDRAGNTRGLERAALIQESLQSIQGDLSTIYAELMGKTAQDMFKNVTGAFDGYLDQVIRTDHGLWEARTTIGHLKAIVSRSAQETAAKANSLQEYLQPHEETLAEATEQQDELQRKGRIARLLHFPLIRRLTPSVERSALAVLDYRVQITACHVAQQHLLTPLADHLDRKLAWLGATAHKLLQAAQICEARAESIAAAPTTARTPLGIDLTDRNYLERWFTEQVAKENGPEGLAAHVRDLFLHKYGTLAWLTEASLEELQDAVTAVCDEISRPLVEGTDALREFQRVYPDANKRKKVFERLIKESEGLLPATAGEVDQPVVWLKAASVPSAEYLTPIKDLLETIDRKPGKYEMAVSSDPTRFVVFQLRGGISLTPFIRRVELPDNEEGWSKAIAYAADPVSAVLAGPNPTLRQFRRVLAKAVACGQLIVDARGGYQIACANGEMLALGDHFTSVEKRLRHNWPHLVFVESTFGRNLVVAEEQTTRELQSLLAGLQADRPTLDQRLKLLDLTAVQECLKQAELLLPRLRRIAQALQRGFLP